MDRMNRMAVTAHTLVTAHVAGAFERLRSEKGQGSVEYAGIVLIVAALVAVAIGAATDDVLTTPIKSAIAKAFKNLGGGE